MNQDEIQEDTTMTKKVNNKWDLVNPNQNYKIRGDEVSDSFLSSSTWEFPVVMFVNRDTGELKIFSRKMAENIGLSNLKLD